MRPSRQKRLCTPGLCSSTRRRGDKNSSLMPLKTYCTERADASLLFQGVSLIGVVWNLGEVGASSGVIVAKYPWFKMTRPVTKSLRVPVEYYVNVALTHTAN
ncbi:hypothetical protein TNCV_368521 [Trichonephila clavipes]|nr:hypothetical protein TNCV_368521 [Trichonephila clavipes]